MNDSINSPGIPGYASVKEAAEMLGLSPRTVYDYIEEGRLPSARLADVIAISIEDIRKFKREPAGRPRKSTPLWRILVQVRVDKHDFLMQKLEVMRRKKQHLFQGTVMRYIAESDTPAEQVILILVWRGTVMPDQVAREEALKEFRQSLDDVLDWNTAQYNNGKVLMHT